MHAPPESPRLVVRSLYSLTFLLALALGCSDDGGANECTPGSEGCACAESSLCFGALECLSGVCVDSRSTQGESVGDATDEVDGGSDDIGSDSSGESTTSSDGTDTETGSSESTGDTTTGGGCPDGLTSCNGECVDTESDTQNCGACGVVCEEITMPPLDSGGCQAGACLSIWSECIPYESLTPCSEVCANEGKTCDQGGCTQGTLFSFGSLDSCELGLGSGSPVPCSEPTVVTDSYYRCCCAQ